jgi:hypothetical protein
VTGSTRAVRSRFPGQTSSLVGKDVRAGAHDCFERFVIELQATEPAYGGFPGYFVRYATGPVGLAPAGIPITLRGHAALLVSLASWMLRPDGPGYPGPHDVFPTAVTHIEEYRLIEDSEGYSTWALGLDTRRNFTVTALSGPPRLVVDLQTSP